MGLAWLALGSACQPTDGSSKTPDPYAYRGNYAIGIPSATGGIPVDTSFQILWTTHTAGSPGRVSVFLHSDSSELALARDLPDTGGFVADLRDLRLPAANYFRVKVADADHPDRMDFSTAFYILPGPQARAYFRPPVGAVLQLDSSYTFGIDLPPGPAQDFDVLLIQGDTVVAYLPANLTGSDLTVRLSGQGVGSGTGFRFRLVGKQGLADSQRFYGLSGLFTIVSPYSGGVDFVHPGSIDTLTAGAFDTLAYVPQKTFGKAVVSGIYSDSAFLAPIVIHDSWIDSGDTVRVLWIVPKGMATGSRYRIGVASGSDPKLPISFSPRFVIRGVGPDAFESDDSPESARVVLPGGPAQDHTLPDRDNDWVAFEAEAEQGYVFRIRGRARFTFSMFQDSLPVVFHQVTSGYPSMLSILFVRAAKSGLYRAGIASSWQQGDAEGFDYALSLHRVDVDADGARLGFTSPVPGSTLKGGDASTIRWQPDSVLFDSTVRIELYRDSVRAQTLAEDAPNTGAFAWNVDPWMESSPQYRIRISHTQDGGIYGQSRPFTIEGIPRDAYEPDDARDQAKPIVPGAPPQVRSLLRSDTDWVAFACKAGSVYRVAATGDFRLILNVFSDLRHTTGGINPTLTGVRGVGECAIQVMPYQSQPGEYGLSVTEEPQ